MHPILADYEVQALDRRRHELIASAERSRICNMRQAEVPSSNSTQSPHRNLIETLAAFVGAGWIARRRALAVR